MVNRSGQKPSTIRFDSNDEIKDGRSRSPLSRSDTSETAIKFTNLNSQFQTMDIKENYEALYNTMHMPLQPSLYYPFDPMTPYVAPCYAMEINGARRKNATRETTSTLKAWLNDHRKNPYPTKGEKIMLAICTKMTLTQVSTWFANARRRLKKENKMTWSPRNRCDDDDDFIDDEPLANSANDKCSSRSASVSSVQQQNNMLQIKNEQQTALHLNNQSNSTPHHSSSATNNHLDALPHPNPIGMPFGLPNGLNGLTNGLPGLPNLPNLPNGLSNSSTLAQQQLAAAIAAANPLPPQLAQLTPQQQQLLLGSDPNSMAAFMQQQLAALHHQQQLHQQLNLNNNLNNHHNKKVEEDSSEIVDVEDNSNLGSLSDSDSINPSAIHQQLNQLTGLPAANHSSNPHHSKAPANHPHSTASQISQSAASLLHQSQNSSHLSSLHSQLAAAAGLNPSVLHPSSIFSAAANAFHVAASNALNALSPMSKSTAASLQAANNKPRIWSIVDIATNSSAAQNLLESSHLGKDNVKREAKNENNPSAQKVPSSSPSSGTSISLPSTTANTTSITNTTSSVKKE